METKGYTLNGVAGRIRDLENKVGGAYYVALCWLAMHRASGKGSKAALETKIFGKDKPTSTFRNAWRIADKAFAEGFHPGHRKTVAELPLDEAVKFAVEALDAHRLALGVTTMKDYEEVCKYASKDAIPPREREQAEDGPTSTQTLLAQRPQMETAISAMRALSHDQLIDFAAKVQDRLAELAVEVPLRLAA